MTEKLSYTELKLKILADLQNIFRKKAHDYKLWTDNYIKT